MKNSFLSRLLATVIALTCVASIHAQIATDEHGTSLTTENPDGSKTVSALEGYVLLRLEGGQAVKIDVGTGVIINS